MKKLTALILIALSVSGSSSTAAEYDPQHTMLALNMAIVSVHRILTTESRAVLEQEYSSIINNLSLGNIESDKDMTALYRDMLSIISRKRISEEDSKRLKSYYDTAEQRRITYALSNIHAQEAKIRLSQRTADNIANDINAINAQKDDVTYSWLGNMAMSCVSTFAGNPFAPVKMVWKTTEAYLEQDELNAQKEIAERKYQLTQQEKEEHQRRLSRLKEEIKQDENMLKEELKLSQWQLERQYIADCNALQGPSSKLCMRLFSMPLSEIYPRTSRRSGLTLSTSCLSASSTSSTHLIPLSIPASAHSHRSLVFASS